MHKLKTELFEILSKAPHVRAVDAEVTQILFHVFRKEDPSIQKLAELSLKNTPPSLSAQKEALRLANARAHGKLLQHLLEHQFFFEHEYFVNESVLIPRPETEVLISAFIEVAKKINRPFRFAELGLGSGILSCEILSCFSGASSLASGVASEVSPQAIAVARKNLDAIAGSWPSRFQILEPKTAQTGFEIFAPVSGTPPFDFVISNPPYVSAKDEIEKQVLQSEPHLALFPQLNQQLNGQTENPDYFYENFILHHQKILTPGGMAFFEIPHERANALLQKFRIAGFLSAELKNDLTGRPRILIAKLPE